MDAATGTAKMPPTKPNNEAPINALTIVTNPGIDSALRMILGIIT